jgi:hypothetical protein
MLRPTRGVLAGPARFWRSWLERTQEKTQALREKDMFRTQMEHLSACERFGPDEYGALLRKLRDAAGFGSSLWNRLSNAQSDPFLKDVNEQEELIRLLAAEQKARLLQMRRAERRSLAQAIGKEEHLVETLVDRLTQAKFLHDWIRARLQEGLPLPQNAQQMELFMLNPNQRRGLPGVRPRIVRPRR